MLVANQGLTQLISFSIPVLVGLYPLAIVLVGLSLLDGWWCSAARVFRPVMAVTLIFGLVDGIAAAGGKALIPSFFTELPLADQSLGWLLPVLVTLVLAVVVDRALGAPKAKVA
jgi:LIVCS family branched-chain amino acid:cation transporter